MMMSSPSSPRFESRQLKIDSYEVPPTCQSELCKLAGGEIHLGTVIRHLLRTIMTNTRKMDCPAPFGAAGFKQLPRLSQACFLVD